MTEHLAYLISLSRTHLNVQQATLPAFSHFDGETCSHCAMAVVTEVPGGDFL